MVWYDFAKLSASKCYGYAKIFQCCDVAKLFKFITTGFFFYIFFVTCTLWKNIYNSDY